MLEAPSAAAPAAQAPLRGAALELLTGTLWQYPWTEAAGPGAARAGLEATGAKLGLRTANFTLKLATSKADGAVSASAAAATSVANLRRMFSGGQTTLKAAEQEVAAVKRGRGARGLVEEVDTTSVAAYSAGVAETTAGLTEALARQTPGGSWPLASGLISEALLAMTFMPDDAPSAVAKAMRNAAAMQRFGKKLRALVAASREAKRTAAQAAASKEARKQRMKERRERGELR